MVGAYCGRWNIETTSQEARSARGLGTTRGWCRSTALRAGPCLLGLSTAVAILLAALPESKRAGQYADQSYQQALAWAKRSLPPSTYLASDKFSFEIPDDNQLALRYGFSYFAKKPDDENAEPAGFVCGRYDPYQGTFRQLRKQAKF